MNFKTMRLDDIIDWCKANNQVEWLKTTANKTSTMKVYPRVRVDGKIITDRTAEPTLKEVPITFIELKMAFVEKFMPEIAPKAEPKAPTMYERIKAL